MCAIYMNHFDYIRGPVSHGYAIGCHMVGEHAAEIIQGMGIALKAGATKAHFDATVGIHPSAAEEFVTMREKAR